MPLVDPVEDVSEAEAMVSSASRSYCWSDSEGYVKDEKCFGMQIDCSNLNYNDTEALRTLWKVY